MQRDHNDILKMTDAEVSSHIVLDVLKNNSQVRSGLIGINNKLEIVSRILACDRLKNIPLTLNIDEACQSFATGIIAFDCLDQNLFVSDSNLIRRMKSICESAGITLIDVMLFGTDDWLSLRRQNRL